MENNKYIITVDLDLPPLQSGAEPYFAYSKFPAGHNFKEELITSYRRLRALLKWARHAEVMILDSVSGRFHPDLIACIFMHNLKKRPLIVLTGDMWNRGDTLKYFIQKTLIHLADPQIQRYVVHSLGEEKIFAQLWGIPKYKVRTCIYNYTLTDKEVSSISIKTSGYIFAGGDPARNYNQLLSCARLLPLRQFIIATHTLNGRKDIPSNVKIIQASHADFIRLMGESDMVVTPLASGRTRAAGQQTYLNAMRLGKIGIVNGKDVLGVTDYIHDHINGIITDDTPKGLSEAIEWVYDPCNLDAVKKIRENAQKSMKKFSYERYIRTMASIIEELVTNVGSKEIA
ncbi:MAG: hypothetical protein IPG80_03835 [Anaerolineales bacterium]|uniref:hypothetical protein n=1 Tax=Candidatus Villigracilis vicinus TaxID=3140679 RepID=UPI003134E80B|nr:hypothetical protein [Anaerolineales bacterium]